MTHINNPQIGDGLVAALCRGKCIYKIAVDHCLDCERIMSPPFNWRPEVRTEHYENFAYPAAAARG